MRSLNISHTEKSTTSTAKIATAVGVVLRVNNKKNATETNKANIEGGALTIFYE